MIFLFSVFISLAANIVYHLKVRENSVHLLHICSLDLNTTIVCISIIKFIEIGKNHIVLNQKTRKKNNSRSGSLLPLIRICWLLFIQLYFCQTLSACLVDLHCAVSGSAQLICILIWFKSKICECVLIWNSLGMRFLLVRTIANSPSAWPKLSR